MSRTISRRRMLGAVLAVAGPTYRPASAVQTVRELRHDRVVLQNYDLSCAAAALATMYHPVPVT